MALFDDASLVTTPNGYKAGTLYSIKPTSGAGDMTVVRATTATRVNSAGLIESVANNVPRLDYSNGSCPSLLVEPQRTNLITYSEDFTQWGTIGSPTITSNFGISPNGTQNSTRLQFNTNDRIFINVSVSGDITFSVYLKGVGQVRLRDNDSSNTKDITLTSEWIRYEFIFNDTITNIQLQQAIGTSDFEIWGAQLEQGSYPTSYIPTSGSTVTRNADVISKTGISSLIGQTEGVLFLDLFASAKNNDANTFGTWLIAGAATENFQIYNLGTTLYWYARNTGGTIIDQTANETLVEGTRYKIAYAYKSGDYALYINGVEKRTSANANVPVAVSQFNLSAGTFGASPVIVKNEYNSVALFPTRLTNAELAQLTTL